jgi:antitoxin CptB
MDLLLGRFADAFLTAMTPTELDGYEALLAENDHDLYAWATGRATPPQRLAELMACVTAHATENFTQQSGVL